MSSLMEQQHLYSKDIGSVGSATKLFGEDKGLLVCRPTRLLRPYYSVPDGAYALVTRFGKDLNYEGENPVWPAGFYWGPPWIKVANIVTKQSVVFNMPVKGCKTQDNVTVQINLAIVFRIMGDVKKNEEPQLVRKFVYHVTARGLEQQLVDACEEATRSVARSLMHQEVYGLRTDKSGKTARVLKGAEDRPDDDLEGDPTLRQVTGPADADQANTAMGKGRDVADDMRRTLNDQFRPQGVEITDVIITDVKLPDQIVQQMAEKTSVVAQNAMQRMTQEFEMLNLKQNEEIETLKQKKKEERDKEKQAGDMQVNEVQVQLDKMKAETKVMLAQIKQDSRVRVQNITANGELEATKLRQEKDGLTTKMHSEAVAKGAQVAAEADKYSVSVVSGADLQATRNRGAAKELMAKAEGVAAPYVEARKQFETRHKQIKVWRALASNKDLIVSGETNEELNTMLLCDAIMDGSAGGDATKSQVLSEMLIMQRGSKVMLNLANGSNNFGE